MLFENNQTIKHFSFFFKFIFDGHAKSLGMRNAKSEQIQNLSREVFSLEKWCQSQNLRFF